MLYANRLGWKRKYKSLFIQVTNFPKFLRELEEFGHSTVTEVRKNRPLSFSPFPNAHFTPLTVQRAYTDLKLSLHF